MQFRLLQKYLKLGIAIGFFNSDLAVKSKHMKNITVIDYDLAYTADSGWAKVQIFGQPIDFTFTQYDAVEVAIELGYLEQPEDRDKTRVGYEKPAFSATVREALPWESRIAYQENADILREFAGTKFAEQIVQCLAPQAPEVRAAIQAEAERIALNECPAAVVEVDEIVDFILYETSHKDLYYSTLNGNVDWVQISDHKKQLWYAAEQETLNSL